jgi:cobalamin synthase
VYGLAAIGEAFGFVLSPHGARAVGAWAVYFPLVGLVLGGLWLTTDYAVGLVAERVVASAAVVLVHLATTRARGLLALGAVLAAMSAGRDRRVAAVAGAPRAPAYAAALVLACAGFALLCALDRFRSVGLAFAPLLGCCSMVVLAVGSRAARTDGRRLKFAPAVQFREFGLATTATFALVFLTTEFLGLLLILATAAFTIAARVFFHWWMDGVNETALLASAEVTQLVVLGVLAAW